MLMKKHVQVIGHRGACEYAPENTMPSFDLAYDLGVESIETDVRVTKDGTLVLFHDSNMARTSNGIGTIEEHTYQELMQLDFGSWFSKKFEDTKIVRLSEFLNKYGNKIHLNLEIKSPDIERIVLNELNEVGLDYTNYVITAFELNKLKKVKELDPKVSTGFLFGGSFDKEKVDLCSDKRIGHTCPNAADMNAETVEYAHDRGLFVRAWGVADLDLMRHVVKCGGDGMTINFPDKLIEFLKNIKQAGEIK
jgi:glycerophosphoryl diester phosphodiesterase